jgi:hypothetical protein
LSHPFPILFSKFVRFSSLFTALGTIDLLWVPSHTGNLGNEIGGALATSCYYNAPSPIKISYSDFIPNLKAHTLRLWNRKRSNPPPTFTVSYRLVYSHVLQFPWFHNIPISRKVIISFSRLRFGYNRLPAHSLYLSLNNSPFCTPSPL